MSDPLDYYLGPDPTDPTKTRLQVMLDSYQPPIEAMRDAMAQLRKVLADGIKGMLRCCKWYRRIAKAERLAERLAERRQATLFRRKWRHKR